MAATLSISDAARASGLSAHTLRYYERAGLLDPIDRSESGHRRFAEADLERIMFLSRLRATGMPIRKVREYAELIRAGDDSEAARLALLEEHREAVLAQLRETRANLKAIDYKIDLYRERLGQQ
jgi:DNA-binding transcriptional MerR regulator